MSCFEFELKLACFWCMTRRLSLWGPFSDNVRNFEKMSSWVISSFLELRQCILCNALFSLTVPVLQKIVTLLTEKTWFNCSACSLFPCVNKIFLLRLPFRWVYLRRSCNVCKLGHHFRALNKMVLLSLKWHCLGTRLYIGPKLNNWTNLISIRWVKIRVDI